jgi:hypothetical protein
MKSETTPQFLDLKFFPYLQRVKDSIDQYKELVDYLNLRQELIKTDNSTLSAYEKNDRSIIGLKTNMELAKTHKTIIEKEQYLEQYTTHITKNMAEMNKCWNWLMEEANKLRKKNKPFAEEFDAIDRSEFETNYEFKLAHYLFVKKAINPSKTKLKSLMSDLKLS